MSRFAFVLLLVLGTACGSEPATQTSRPAQSVDWSALAPGWTNLPAPPYVAACASSAWTGRELVYWGGDHQCQEGTARNEGGVFDPSARSWRRLPPSPLGGRSSATAVWTGKEVLVWGGWADGLRSDGAAYDPAQDSWRRLPKAPSGPRLPVASAWSGTEMLVWGSRERIGEIVTGAAYDPATDDWRELPPAPFGLNQAEGVWTGRELIVYGALLDGNNVSERPHARGLAYDPAADAWRELPSYPLSPQASTVVWTGDEMIAWDYELHAAAYDPATNAWRPLPDLPLDFSDCYPKGAFVDRFVLAWHCGRAAVFDLASGTWRKLSRPPGPVVGDPVEAGAVVLFAGAWPGAGNMLSVFKPGPIGPTKLVPRTARHGERDYLPLTFPDGTEIVLSYPFELDLPGLDVQPSVSYLYQDDRPPRFELTLVYGPAAAGPNQVAIQAGVWTVLADLRSPEERETVARSLSGRETRDGFPVLEATAPLALSDELGEGGGPRLTIGGEKDRWIELWPNDCGLPEPEIGSGYGAKCLGDLYVGVYGDRPFIEAVLAGLRLESG